MSPKTGTPVKLLGREDASVDWYNLEKSKRVKAFRCGEFDACIEKAKSSQGTPVKRREKYARREDAILHALELERKQLASKYQNQVSRTDDISSIPFADMRREFDNSSSEYYLRNNTQKPQLPLENSASQQCKDLSSTRYKSKKSKKRKGDNSNIPGKTNEHEQNFAGSKRNFSESLVLETSENTLGNPNSGFSHLGHIQSGSIVENSGKNTSLKKKRSEECVFEESLVKKHDRCRPLAQVVQSSVKLPHCFQRDDDSGTVLIEEGKDPLPTIYQAKQSWSTYMSNDSGDANSHGDIPSTQMTFTGAHFKTEGYLKQPDSFSAEQTFSDFVEKQGSDSLERECSETETEDDAELLQKYAKRQSPESDACDPYSLQASNKLKHVDCDHDELTFSTCIPQQDVLKDEDGSSELGVSQWHMKGKRNQRNALKRPMGKTDGNLSLDKTNGLLKGSLYRVDGSDRNMESIGASNHQYFGQSFYQTQEELDCDYDETDLFNKVRGHPEVRYYCKDYPSSLKPTRDLGQSYTSFNNTENYYKTSPPNKNGDQISSVGRKAYLEGASLYRQNYASHLGYMGPMLFNVDLNVQAGYQGEHVPLVSLMSRLNGKAIVGHPIQIEILEDGSTDHLVASDDFLGHSASASPAWRTGRRTAMPRVPRSNSTRVTLDCDDDEGLWDMKPPFNKSSTHFSQQSRLSKRSNTSLRRPLSHKSQKKASSSKKGSSSNQKVRALSSISIGKRHHREGGQAKLHSILGDLIKPEGAIPLVTCVPAKVVFSRIMEAVGRPSLAIAHRARMASPAIRDPL